MLSSITHFVMTEHLQVHLMEQRFKELQQLVLDAECETEKVLLASRSEASLLGDLVRATVHQGVGNQHDVWILCASSRFALSKVSAELCSEWFQMVLNSGMRESSLHEICLPDVDEATARILQLCMVLGSTKVNHILLPQVAMELTPMLSAIMLAHRLLMPWMARSIAEKFLNQFRELTSTLGCPIDGNRSAMEIAFDALAVASKIESTSPESEDVWKQVTLNLKGGTMSFIAQNIELATGMFEFTTIDREYLLEVISVVTDADWCPWQQVAVPQGKGRPDIWNSQSIGTETSQVDFLLQVTNLSDPEMADADSKVLGACDVGAFVYLKNDVTNAFSCADEDPTIFNSSGLFRFQVVAHRRNTRAVSFGKYSGLYGVTAELSEGRAWGWECFIPARDRDKYVHRDTDLRGGSHYKFAFRASLLQLHRQVFALMRYVGVVKECRSDDTARLLCKTFDYFRDAPDASGRTGRVILSNFAASSFKSLILANPIVFSSLACEEVQQILHAVLRNMALNGETPVSGRSQLISSIYNLAALWICGAYNELKQRGREHTCQDEEMQIFRQQSLAELMSRSTTPPITLSTRPCDLGKKERELAAERASPTEELVLEFTDVACPDDVCSTEAYSV
jgi:hypothetical protein